MRRDRDKYRFPGKEAEEQNKRKRWKTEEYKSLKGVYVLKRTEVTYKWQGLDFQRV